jgi:hypothetical protein
MPTLQRKLGRNAGKLLSNQLYSFVKRGRSGPARYGPASHDGCKRSRLVDSVNQPAIDRCFITEDSIKVLRH